MLAPEVAHPRGQEVGRQGGGDRQVDPSAFEPPVALGDLAGMVQVTNHLAGRPDERLTGRGEHQPAPDPAEQFHAEVALQTADDL